MNRPALLTLLLLSGVAHAAPADAVKFSATLAQMLGHYDASVMSLQARNLDSARKHATHPANELYDLIKADLTPALRTQFQADYTRLNTLLHAAVPNTTQFQSALKTFEAHTQQAQALVPAVTRTDPKFIARVISRVAGSAQSEYEEGVEQGKVINLNEYQDAQTYLARAQRWLSSNSARLPADQGGQTATALQAARAVILRKGEASALATQIRRAQTELAEISGDALPQASTGPQAEFDQIEALLQKAKGHYASGMADDANEAVISAYLDHYEQLEAPLGRKDAALEGRLEVTLRDTLRGLIRSKVSSSAFNAAVDAARAELVKARALLD
ncbi:hypothetical protein [Deinococcus sonorensis]|uniref:DUF3829 domain-containing protein n=2 Tax=Deinococcus sonorensis TaxID=309891 RepID=A0AAU7UBT0_9DEIO